MPKDLFPPTAPATPAPATTKGAAPATKPGS